MALTIPLLLYGKSNTFSSPTQACLSTHFGKINYKKSFIYASSRHFPPDFSCAHYTKTSSDFLRPKSLPFLMSSPILFLTKRFVSFLLKSFRRNFCLWLNDKTEAGYFLILSVYFPLQNNSGNFILKAGKDFSVTTDHTKGGPL